MYLSCRGISKSFGATEILKDVSFILEDREKAALVGVNGAGKTTLFRILIGELEPDGGEVSFKKEISYAYMPQSKISDMPDEDPAGAGPGPSGTVYDELLTVFSGLIGLERSIRGLEELMANGDGSQETLERYHRETILFEERDGYGYLSRVRGVLKGLGFSGEDSQKNMFSLSGGEKTRVALGKLLLRRPDLLLLDEPTNHLDINAIGWLENFLSNYPGGVVIISHDRYFLDKVVTKVIELEHTRSTVYPGSYTDFSVRKEIGREIAMKHFILQQKEIKRQEEVIRTLRSYNTEKSIKRAQSREKLLAKMDRLERPENLPDEMRMTLSPRLKSGFDVLSVTELAKSFGRRELFKNVSIEIKSGEKTALIGPNGIGKTTLLRIIQNRLRADAGEVRLGANVSVAYYDQENVGISGAKTIFDEIYDEYPNLTVTEIRNVLAAFVFTGDEVFKKISSLSGGEAGRVALAKIMLGNANFLLLDEPTNHLDMYSREILENALNGYSGTILFVSHDRYFINSVADKILELSEVGVRTYYGDYDYYLEKKDSTARDDAEDLYAPSDGARGEKQTRAARKKEESLRRRRENAVVRCEREIGEAETEAGRLGSLLMTEEVATDAARAEEIYIKKAAAEDRLKKLYAEWENLFVESPAELVERHGEGRGEFV